uniref:Uncharacterized protein n=1 Tax=Anguilla anguilla TaxID=7936 RepID=A0A0E9WQZ7_ANGAN
MEVSLSHQYETGAIAKQRERAVVLCENFKNLKLKTNMSERIVGTHSEHLILLENVHQCPADTHQPHNCFRFSEWHGGGSMGIGPCFCSMAPINIIPVSYVYRLKNIFSPFNLVCVHACACAYLCV